MVRAGLSLLISILGVTAVAETTSAPDLTGVIGDYAVETGTRGAVTNRRLADQLYKQSLEDESNAWKSFPPNIPLLSRALANSKDAKAADDQAKEFARAAMHGMVSGNQSGPFDAAGRGVIGPDKLKDLAENDSPYQKQVEARMNAYSGVKLDADKMVLKTPFGDFSANISRETMEAAMRGAARVLGYDPDEVTKGLQDAARLRDAIAAKTMKEVDAEIAAAKAKAGNASKTAANADGAAAGSGEGENESARDPASKGLEPQTVAENEATGTDWDAKQRAFLEQQNAIRRQLGMRVMSNQSEPLGAANQNLFQMVHEKYQAMRGEGAFIETLDPVAVRSVRPNAK